MFFDARLREGNAGTLQGKPLAEVDQIENEAMAKGANMRLWNDYNGESYDDILRRASYFIQTELLEYWKDI